MIADNDITRFVEAQDGEWSGYTDALAEIRNGRKTSHWIWYIFPQLRGLGHSFNANYYGLADRNEAEPYLAHPILGPRLREITSGLLDHKDKTAREILHKGQSNNLKVAHDTNKC